MNTAMSSNFIVSGLFSVGMQSLFGMIRQMTYLTTIIMLEVPYANNLFFFYTQVIVLLGLDLLQGPYWYELAFTFRETSPFNENFEVFDVGDMNFLMNSGSLPLLLCLIILSAMVWYLVLQLAKCCYRSHFMRHVGIVAESNTSVIEPLALSMTEGYIEVFMPAMLSVISVFSRVDGPTASYWFETPGDCVNAVLGLTGLTIALSLPLYIHHLVLTHGADLDEP